MVDYAKKLQEIRQAAMANLEPDVADLLPYNRRTLVEARVQSALLVEVCAKLDVLERIAMRMPIQ